MSEENQTKESDQIKVYVDRVIRFVSPSKYYDGSGSGGDSEDDNDMEAQDRGSHGKLPQLGRLDFYDVETTKSDRLWRLEARRLMMAADSPADRLLLSSRHGPAPLDREGFDDLAELTDKILCALHICTLDDQIVLHQTYPSAVDKWRWMQCQSALRNRTDDSHDLPGRDLSRDYAFDARERELRPVTRGIYYEEREEVMRTVPRHETSYDEDEEVMMTGRKREVFTEPSQRRELEDPLAIEVDPNLDQDKRHIETHETPPVPHGPQISMSSQQPKTPKRRTTIQILTPPVPERRQPSNPRKLQQVADPERYCAVVDHVTAVLARIATQRIRSSYWRTIVIAVLTMLSTKLKVVAIDLPANVDGCLSRCEELYLPGIDQDGGNARLGEWQFQRISDNDATTSRYSMENAAVGRWLTSCLTQVLVELGAKRPVHVPREKVDVCAMIFRSGADDLLTLMHQDRHGNIDGLCDALPLAFSGAAISMVMELGKKMKKQQPSTKTPPPRGETAINASRPYVLLEASTERMLDDGGIELETTSIKLVDIASLVTLLVPLSLGKASLAHEFKRTLQAISALAAFGDVVPIATDFTALVQLSSEGSAGNGPGISREKEVLNSYPDMVTVKPLSQSGLARRRLHLLDPDAMDLPFCVSQEVVKSHMKAAKERLKDLNRKTEEWAIDGEAVIVQCPVYVWSTVAVCSILVLGGFMIAFFVGERIPGVDPFGIASFTWVLAGFIILIAKSVRVSEWPWRDFLLGRVTCRSITELHSVTRVDAQDIIMYFLSTRARNPLRTCGPFNTPFRERRPGGFSIDVKIKLQTLWACGIIPLEVTTLEGPKLVLLDLARGRSGLTSAEHSAGGYAQNNDLIAACMDLPPGDDCRDAPLGLHYNVVWIKIGGIYNCMERRFR